MHTLANIMAHIYMYVRLELPQQTHTYTHTFASNVSQGLCEDVWNLHAVGSVNVFAQNSEFLNLLREKTAAAV